jgi:hypothetical protein
VVCNFPGGSVAGGAAYKLGHHAVVKHTCMMSKPLAWQCKLGGVDPGYGRVLVCTRSHVAACVCLLGGGGGGGGGVCAAAAAAVLRLSRPLWVLGAAVRALPWAGVHSPAA